MSEEDAISKGGTNTTVMGRPRESHPFNHLGLGERPYLILVRYPHGARDREFVVQLLREHPCKKACCVNHLSGEFDLAIWLWVPAGKLDGILQLIKSALGSPEIVVYPIQRLSTPFQRGQDVPGVRAILFDRHFTKEGGLWTPDGRATSPREADVTGKTRFYTIITTRIGESGRVFHRLLDKFSRERTIREEFEQYTVCTYKAEMNAGCIITAYTTSWERNEIALLKVLDDLPPGAHSRTYLCFKAHLEGDEPWIQSRDAAQAPTIASLKTRALRAITGTYLYRDHDPRNTVPRIEPMFADEGIRRSLLTYDPAYWWDLTADVNALIADIVTGTGEKFAGIILKQYIELDQQLCDAVRALFAAPKPKSDKGSEKNMDLLILSSLEIFRFREHAALMQEAMDWVNNHEDLAKRDRAQLNIWVGKARRYFEQLEAKEAHLTLGTLDQVITGIHERKLLPKTKFLNFKGNLLMAKWEENLRNMARDRDLLAHGSITCAFDEDEEGEAYWERLLPNYIKAVPQVKVLLRELRRAFRERCEQRPIRLPLKRKGASARRRSGGGPFTRRRAEG